MTGERGSRGEGRNDGRNEGQGNKVRDDEKRVLFYGHSFLCSNI